MSPQRTIARDVEVAGIGLHTGEPASVRLRPGPPGQGIVFTRVDLTDAPTIPARLTEVLSTERGVVLGRRAPVATVEHLLSAASGLGVDNLIVEVRGPELPCGDGSALLFTRALQEAGCVEQPAPRVPIVLTTPVWVEADGSLLVAVPAAGLRVTSLTTLDRTRLAPQAAEFDAQADDYASAIAPARTWGLATDAEALRARGLARGASLATALVLGPDGFFNEPRFPNEPARHKILDLIGDLSLLGRPLHAHLVAIRSGHALHVELARAIARSLAPTRADAGARTDDGPGRGDAL